MTSSAQNIREQINNAQTTDELMSTFTSWSDNAYVRILALKRMISLFRTPEGELPQMNETSDGVQLLYAGLTDENARVVQTTMELVGKFRAEFLQDSLLVMYQNARQRFPGMGDQIRWSAIEALGRIGGSEAEQLFTNIINSGRISYVEDNAIYAIGLSQNSSLIPLVNSYINRVENALSNNKITNI